VVGALRLGARDVDPPSSIRAVGLGQRTQRLTGQRDRRTVAEMLGLGTGQFVQVSSQIERMASRADGFGQRFFGKVQGLISQPARFVAAFASRSAEYPQPQVYNLLASVRSDWMAPHCGHSLLDGYQRSATTRWPARQRCL